MSEESIFQAKIQKLMRIAIPKAVWQGLDLKEGDTVRVKISKVK